MQKPDFKNRVLTFDKDMIKPKVKDFITNEYLNKVYDIAAFYKASKAAGPLAEWVKSIIEYSTIFLNIEPMRNKLKQKQTEALVAEESLAATEAEIESLSTQKTQLEADYE